jgi:putative restriction endonuclease
MPWSLAWQSFGEANGARSAQEMRVRIAKYRRTVPDDRSDFPIGCRILTQPFFLDEVDWIPAPASWSPNIVSLKSYRTDDAEGAALWEAVAARMQRLAVPGVASAGVASAAAATGSDTDARFGGPRLIRPRLGQGAFRILVTYSYGRRCAITREKTLPALEAAHIRPYGAGGEHEASNGLLLRRDIHSLFDAGYVTVTPDLRFEVSRRIREEFENGRHYYELHGQEIVAPTDAMRRPDRGALEWHNVEVFRG